MNSLKTYLTEAYAIDDKSILRILTQNKQINKADPNYSYYEKLASWANSSGKQQKLKNIDLSTIQLSDKGLIEKRKLSTRYTTLGHLLLALKNLMDQEGKYTPSNELSKLIQQTTLEILVALSGIKNPKMPEEPNNAKNNEEDIDKEPKDNSNQVGSNDTEELRKGIDWTAEKARRLANANGIATSKILDKFYSDYYNLEYAGGTNDTQGDTSIISKLESLSKILIPEFNALGYNPEVNPLAQFLKILIKHKRDIFDKLTANTYGAIHNSYIAKHITGNMLGNYDSTKIIFCSDLYNYKGLDIVNYLSLQNQVLKAAEKDNKYSNDKTLIAKIFIQQDIPDDSYENKIRTLLNLSKVTLPDAPKAKMKSELEIQELYRYLFKSIPKKRADVKEIITKAAEQGIVLNMIQYIISQKAFEEKWAPLVREMKIWLADVKYKENETKIKKSKELLSGYLTDIQVEKLIILELQKYYNTNTKDKSNK